MSKQTVQEIHEECSIIAAAKRGDRGAYCELCHRHSEQVFRTILRIVHNPADAEDVLQETLIRGFKNLDYFREESAFSTWLTSIAINSALMFMRRHKNKIGSHISLVTELKDKRSYDFPDRSRSPEDLVRDWQLADLLRRAITKLPPRLQCVAWVYCYKELNTKEIALCLGLTESTVKTRLHRARTKLRQALVRQLGKEHLSVFSTVSPIAHL